MSPQPEPPMTSPPSSPKHPLALSFILLVWVGAVVVTIHLHVYWKRRIADAEAYRAGVVRAAFDGNAELALRYEEARK